jgi:BirA family biotin operon repressor/biotin-[acetyl-CoA-carboxylase] ligase
VRAEVDPLLAALEGRAWCSGATLARRLGISRAAVWKRVELLRRRGYAIEAEAGKGYRLVETTKHLLPAEIRRGFKPRRLTGDIVHREVIDSTNRLASDLARRGAAEGTIVIAEQQSAGRGRLGRTWSSPPGLNLYCSIVLRPPLPPTAVPRLTLVAAIALADAVAATIRVRPEIKWPNDLLLAGRKAAGILTELDAEADRVRFAVVGIGVNLNARREDFPPELRRKATSLSLAEGAVIDRAAFTARLLGAFDAAYDEFLRRGFARLRRRYEGYHALAGQGVSIEGGKRIAGTVRGIDDDGALLVETGRGVERVVAGEVTLRRSYAAVRRRAG